MAKSDHLKPSRLMTLQAKMEETGGGVDAASNGTGEASLGQQGNAEAAAAAGRAPPNLPENALVVTHTGNVARNPPGLTTLRVPCGRSFFLNDFFCLRCLSAFSCHCLCVFFSSYPVAFILHGACVVFVPSSSLPLPPCSVFVA